MKKVLVIGGGGREHAIAWKLAQSDLVEKVYVAPGNAGTAIEPKCENIDIQTHEIYKLLGWAVVHQPDLTVIGPETPLVEGIVDRFNLAGLLCFGPSATAAQLEGSKAFAKKFMREHNIPTADYAVFTNVTDAQTHYKNRYIDFPFVVKEDGLAAGKGVTIVKTPDEADIAIVRAIAKDEKVILEEYIEGQEVSFIVMSDGKNIVPLETSQDYKRAYNNDEGPNTGGMGAISPSPIMTSRLYWRIMNDIIRPTIKGMAEDGIPFVGFLYAGIMVNKEGEPKVLEYNVRLGDPETQPLMMRLESDLFQMCYDGAAGITKAVDPIWNTKSAVSVVMAAGGYPRQPETGDSIRGLDEISGKKNTKVFYAGVEQSNTSLPTTNGGRILSVTSLGKTFKKARSRAYKNIERIQIDGAFYRSDIGDKAIK